MTSERCLELMEQSLAATPAEEKVELPKLPPVKSKRSRPWISVIIPVCNRVQYLDECLRSVLQQAGDDVEVLLADDHSDVSVTGLAPPVQVHRNAERLGQWRNVNQALARARGEWIHLLHDDDKVENGFYQAFRDSLQGAPATVGMACGRYRVFRDDSSQVRERAAPRVGAGVVEQWPAELAQQNPLTVPAVIMKREVFETVGQFAEDIDFCADWELYLRASTRWQWWFEPAALAWHREHANSVTAAAGRIGEDAEAIRRTLYRAQQYLPKPLVAIGIALHAGRFLEGARVAFLREQFDLASRLLREAVLLGQQAGARRAIGQLAVRRRLHRVDPYQGFDYQRVQPDLQGWGHHPIFEEVIREVRPGLVVEVGTWKGASALEMARALRKYQVPGVVLCVDTWLGGLEHLLMEPPQPGAIRQHYRHGYPNLYYQFLANVMHEKLTTHVIPFAATSPTAARWMAHHGVEADVVYIDASHVEDDVLADLVAWWPRLRPGGVLFGDDWSLEWYGVVCAVNRFARDHGLTPRTFGDKWVLQKPGGG
ncbi:MAG: class I SAM-dependent methyltransferase [Candidatus Xenobia bacterium]